MAKRRHAYETIHFRIHRRVGVACCGGVRFVKLGLAPVATAAAPLPFEKQIATAALHARVNREAPKSSPIAPSDQVYLAGAQIYRANRASVTVCLRRSGRHLPKASSLHRRSFSKGKALLMIRLASLTGKLATVFG